MSITYKQRILLNILRVCVSIISVKFIATPKAGNLFKHIAAFFFEGIISPLIIASIYHMHVGVDVSSVYTELQIGPEGPNAIELQSN